MQKLRIPVVGSLTNRKPDALITDTTDQQFINCFPEVTRNPVTGKAEVTLLKRLGSAASSTVQAGATGSGGSIVWTTYTSSATAPVIFSFIKSGGGTTMFFDSAGSQIGGDVAGTVGTPSMSETLVSGTPTLTAALEDSGTFATEFWYFPFGGAWTQITDSDFPANVQAGHAHMDGFMFVMDSTGKISNSDLNSVSSWTANNYISLTGGGQGVGVARLKDMIVGFTDYSTEFFYNAGNPTGSVLKRVDGGTLRIGAIRAGFNQKPFLSVKEDIYLIGIDASSGAKGIYKISGLKADKISSPSIDRLLENGQFEMPFGSFGMFGQTHVAFRGTATSHLLCYSIENNYWWIFNAPNGSGGSLSIVGMCGYSDGSRISKSFFTTGNSGKIYTMNPNSPLWTDDGTAHTMTVRTGQIDLDTNKRKFWRSISVVGDSQSSTSNIGVSYSDNDYSSFSTARNIDMSVVPPVKLFALGSSVSRAWQLTHSSGNACRLRAMEIEYEVAA